MPTGERWGKGNAGEMLAFETFLNSAPAAELDALATDMRAEGADLIDVYYRAATDDGPDHLGSMIRANWFGIHDDPLLANRPMWASNARLSPEASHAVMRETFARIAEWVAADRGDREVRVWTACGEPELQTWVLTPATAGARAAGAPAIGHVFVATPFNSGYPHNADEVDHYTRSDDAPCTVMEAEDARELLAALIDMTSLGPGTPVGRLVAAAEQVTRAKAAFGRAAGTDDNALFGAICHCLIDPLDGTPPPFVGTGLARAMGGVDVEVSAVGAAEVHHDDPPGDERLRSSALEDDWAAPYEGVHLRHVG